MTTTSRRFFPPLLPLLLLLFVSFSFSALFVFGAESARPTTTTTTTTNRKTTILEATHQRKEKTVDASSSSSSSTKTTTKNKERCEECLSFFHNATERVRSKEFRGRIYKVVDEMCERVFGEDDEKITDCKAMGKTYAKRAMEYAKTHEEEAGKFACEKMKLCDAYAGKENTEKMGFGAMVGAAARATVRRAREEFASGKFIASWFLPSSSSSSSSSGSSSSSSSSPTSLCVFCEYGASKLATAMNDPAFAAAARQDFVAACQASKRFSTEQCENAADEYETKLYGALQTWLDDGEACEDLFSC